MERKKSLKQGIYVDREYNNEDEAIRKKLRLILRFARSKETYRGNCKLDKTTLVIKNKRYNLSNLHELPDDISCFNATSKSTESCLGFFGELNPMSNFYPISLVHNGLKFHSSEQYIQHTKAMFFKDMPTAKKILNCDTALQCKKISKDISNYNHEEWRNQAQALCEPGISAKFLQNHKLQHVLQSTGNKHIVESCKDSLWGTGIPLNSAESLKEEKWYHQGILGLILENI